MTKTLLALSLMLAMGSVAVAAERKISPEELQARVSGGETVTVVDVRSESDFKAKHIEGAIGVPRSRIVNAGLPRKGALVLYCAGEGCPVSSEAARELAGAGYENILVLDGGILAWEAKGYPIVVSAQASQKPAVPAQRITPRALKAKLGSDGFSILDVRPSQEFKAGHLPGALSIPLETIAEGIGNLKAGAEVVVYDRDGKRSREAAEKLAAAGLKALELSGGLPVWVAMKLPLEI